VVRTRPAWAVVLAGGSGRRLGLIDKPALRLGSVSLLDIALTAVAPARTVVVGPPRELGTEVLQTREIPPGGGPAAAVAAGVECVALQRPAPGHRDLVVVLAADLPGIDAGTVDLLTAAVLDRDLPGAVLLDPSGRSQYLAGVWRWPDLLDRCRSRPSWDGGRLSDLLGPLIGDRLPVDRRASADLDTTADALEWGVHLPRR
jgi:molybdopterin-guanine dinucleotide biosynthesis protein A